MHGLETYPQPQPQPQPSENFPQSTLDDITQDYDQVLKTQFSKALPLASSPGPGVLIVSPAITAVSASTKRCQQAAKS